MTQRLDWLFDRQGAAVAARHAKRVHGCAECGKTAIYRVGAKGYCRAHYDEAVRHAKKKAYNSEYNARVNGTAFDPE